MKAGGNIAIDANRQGLWQWVVWALVGLGAKGCATTEGSTRANESSETVDESQADSFCYQGCSKWAESLREDFGFKSAFWKVCTTNFCDDSNRSLQDKILFGRCISKEESQGDTDAMKKCLRSLRRR